MTTTTLYLNDPATGAMSERVARGPTTPTNWNSFNWGAAPWGGVTWGGVAANGFPAWVDTVV